MTDRSTGSSETQRLDATLARLVAAGRLTRPQALEIRTEFAATPGAPTSGVTSDLAAQTSSQPVGPSMPGQGPEPWRALLPEVGGYLGGVFVIAATVVLAGPHWADISRLLQVLLLAVPAALLIAAGVFIAMTSPQGWSPHAGRVPAGRRRVVAVLLTGGAVLGAGAAAVITGPDAADRAAFSCAAALLLGSYVFCRTVLTHLSALFSCVLAIVSWTVWATHQATGTENASVPIGIALGVLACAWMVASISGLLDERHLGVMAASAVLMAAAEVLAVGGQSTIASAAGYLLLLLLAVGGLVGYVRSRFVGLLVVGVVTLSTVVPQAVLDYTNGATGAGGGLLLVGLSILGASVLGFRLRRSNPPDR